MKRSERQRQLGLWITGLWAVAGCGGGQIGEAEPKAPDAISDSIVTWEEFLRVVYTEPETGLFIVDGDTPIVGLPELRRFYQAHVMSEQGLIVATNRGVDVRWDAQQKLNLSYCINAARFGSRYSAVVSAMNAATAAWEAAANVAFVHLSAEDARCTAQNTAVLFDVNPVNVRGSYLARSFFPDQARSTRNVLIDNTAFGGSPSLTGILRHELGHVLGFRHEHTRPEAGACFEDNNWRPLTPYDAGSVMHYPQCNGTGSALELTAADRRGVALLYGAPGTSPTPTPTPTPGGGVLTETDQGTVARGQSVRYQPLDLAPGSVLDVALTGTGDADLYIQLGAAPTTRSFACRPFLDSSNESCRLQIPSAGASAYIVVRGYTDASYQLVVSYTPL